MSKKSVNYFYAEMKDAKNLIIELYEPWSMSRAVQLMAVSYLAAGINK